MAHVQSHHSTESTPQYREGQLTQKIEHQTARTPSILFLVMAAGAGLLSLGLAASQRDKSKANFVGLWVPSILLLGIYNKMVKLHGSDQEDNQS